MYAVFIGVGVLVLASLFRWSAGKVRKKYSCFFFLEFFSGGFALIDTEVVRIHYPPRLDSSVVEHFLGKEEVVSPILTRGSHGGIAQLARAYDS